MRPFARLTEFCRLCLLDGASSRISQVGDVPLLASLYGACPARFVAASVVALEDRAEVPALGAARVAL